MAVRISKDMERQLRSQGLLPPAKSKPRGMNRTEAEYAGWLECEKVFGAGGDAVQWFAFEAIRLRLADGTYFKPDFPVLFGDGRLEFHEVKGFLREAAWVRLRVAAEMYPFRFVLVRKTKAGWSHEVVPGRRS